MHSLFVRIFVLFWIAMALIVGGSIAITFTVAAREYESQELQRRPNIALQASEVLATGGIEPHPQGSPPPGNFRPPRFAPQIVGPDGLTYTVLLVPRRPSIFGALSLPGISLTVLGIALIVSAFASWWLAQHLSAPIRRIQAGARAQASKKLDLRAGELRVSAGLENRKDELAVLARDFDAMADQLRANRAVITRLLRDISHELRSPLARMRVAVGLARQPGGDLPRQLDRLEREIERLDGLIDQVLKLARLHGTDAPFERQEFDVDEVIEEVVRYSPPGAQVDVSVVRRDSRSPDAGVAGLAIVIRDRGPGVPAGDLERIFEPCYRVAESRERDTGGEGVGLAITAQVMKAHGGSATANRPTDGGLEVILSLGDRC